MRVLSSGSADSVKVGFIGAGRMGRPMVGRLAAAGHHVTVLARRPETRSALEAAGIPWAATVAATVAAADVVFVVVLTDQQVQSVCLGPEGAVLAMAPGSVLVQHTTSDPMTATLLAERATAAGITVLDAALSGGPHDIAAGRLTLWVGGVEDDLARVRALLETYASTVTFVGPHGNGQRVKLVNNALFVAQVGLAVDAVRLAAELGIAEQTILQAVKDGSGGSRALSVVAALGSISHVAPAVGDLMRKDVAVVHELARRSGADLGIIGTVIGSEVVKDQVLGPSQGEI